MHKEISRRSGVFALLLAISALCAGCSGKGGGGGDTVPSPPRELVEKSFYPPAGTAQPGAAAANANGSTPASGGK